MVGSERDKEKQRTHDTMQHTMLLSATMRGQRRLLRDSLSELVVWWSDSVHAVKIHNRRMACLKAALCSLETRTQEDNENPISALGEPKSLCTLP